MGLKDEAFCLLREWCDALIDLRVHSPRRELDGGILCPACSFIHGRCGDLVLPLTYLYTRTGDEKYLAAARGVVDYSEANLKRPDGTYYNDVNQTWRGISVFSALAIGETLLRFGDRLDGETREKWRGIFDRLQAACIRLFSEEIKSPNVNYFAGMAALMALSYRLTGEDSRLRLADLYEQRCRSAFDSDGLLTGEGGSLDYHTDKGARPIDMGYNLEESLPLLIKHAVWLQDAEKTDFYTARTLDHLAFVLPDGAIDNSFGTRMNKWTYWGSRTSDGLIGGLSLIAGRDLRIARAIKESFKLRKSCSHGGLLYAGLMQCEAGEPPCAHHTITNAKALSELCMNASDPDFKDADSAVLDRECEGIKGYQGGNLITVTRGKITATVNASDALRDPNDGTGGGTVTVLYHKNYGTALCATVHTYVPKEPYNMQHQRNCNTVECMTPRLIADGYSQDLDGSVTLSVDGFTVTAENDVKKIRITYEFLDTGMGVTVFSEKDGLFLLPLVAHPKCAYSNDEKRLLLDGLILKASEKITLKGRAFHQVGGFSYIVTEMPVRAGSELKFEIRFL